MSVTVDANVLLGFPADMRDYGVGAHILSDLGVHSLRLLTNNPAKYAGLRSYGLEVAERVPLIVDATSHNASYIETKRVRMGHLFDAPDDSAAENGSETASGAPDNSGNITSTSPVTSTSEDAR